MTTYRAHVRLTDIAPSPTNPRKHFNEAKLAELADNIKEHGVITAVLLRTNPSTDPNARHYELIFGERRWRAAQMAGIDGIPADVRDDLTDEAVVALQLIENLQREDLHPLEEAEGYDHLIRHHGHTVEQIADKIKKSRSYIFGRLKLLDLDEDSRRLFYAGALNPSTALLVARIPSTKLKAKAIEDLTRTDWHGDAPSVRQAQRLIRDRYMLKLDDAPFPSEDGELIATAGPCSACPKRTGNSPDLFDDVDSANVCTDPDCFAAKKIAAAERRAREAGPDVKVVTGEEAEKIMPSYSSESRTHAKLDSTCYDDPKHRTYREILGNDSSAITLVENQRKGELVPVVAKKVITEKLKAEGVVTAAQKNRDENKKIKAQVALANAFRDRLFRKIRDEAHDVSFDAAPNEYDFGQLLCDAMPIITRRFLIDATRERGEQTASLWGAIGHNSFDRLDAFRNGLANFKLEEQLLICLDLALLAEHHTDEHNLKRQPEGMLAMAKVLEIDADELLNEVKESLKPAPKVAKKGKKSAPATSEDHYSPSEAAQAAGINRAESDGAATEAARAGEEDSLEAPADAEAERPSSGSIEPNEKPTEAQPLFAVGDTVRIRDIPDPRYGLKPTLAGREGEVTAFWYASLEYGVTIDGDESIFIPEMLELVEKGVVESDAKQSPSSRPSVKYRHPQNAELEWTGRGRKPKWVEHYLAGGMTLDDLKVEGAAA